MCIYIYIYIVLCVYSYMLEAAGQLGRRDPLLLGRPAGWPPRFGIHYRVCSGRGVQWMGVVLCNKLHPL